MTNHARKTIRAAAVTALTSLTTTGARVYDSLVYPMQDAQLPGLRIDTADEDITVDTVGSPPLMERTLQLVVQACVKQNSTYNDTIDTIIKEVEVAVSNNQSMGGAKAVLLKSIHVETSGESEKPVSVATLLFEVPYYTAQSAPDVAL
jgi:hypothetical protein